jgi:Stress responsive A/B Barrel Domain
MKHFNFLFLFIGVLGIMVACTGSDSGETMNNCELAGPEIQHMVIFNLPYPEGSEEAGRFLDDGARILTSIPVVQHFQAFRQVSAKNDYQYGFSMVFANQEDYNTYNNHPDHLAFVQERWNREVTGFLEIDLKKR